MTISKMYGTAVEKNESFQIFPKLSFGDKRDWFFEKRFGLFLHWGIYSVGGL